MKNKKYKTLLIIIVLILVGVIVYNNTIGRVILQKNMKEQLSTYAYEYGMTDVSVRLDDTDFHQVFIYCSNFTNLDWDSVFEMDEKMSSIKGVNGVVYVQGTQGNGQPFYVYEDKNEIHSYNQTDDIVYSGGWNDESTENRAERQEARQEAIDAALNQQKDEIVDDTEKATCWALAKEVVLEKLKSPSSAKFPTYGNSDVTITCAGNLYTVKGYVDAENSFGASIRTTFTVTMEKSGSGDNAKFTAKTCVIDE